MLQREIAKWLYNTSLWVNSNRYIRWGAVGLALLFAIGSLVFADYIRREMVDDEYERTMLWARATQVFASRDEASAMDLMADIVSSNNSIPVILTDQSGRIISYNNIELSSEDKEGELRALLEEFREDHPPIIVDGTPLHYLYYSDSLHLQRLVYLPYAQFAYFLVLIFGIVYFIRSVKRADQNRIWEGLSRETAHQLGTPISSLIAWREYLVSMGTDRMITDEIGKDIQRLEVIANRFQKVGSAPLLQAVALSKLVQFTLDYLRPRISKQVSLILADNREDDIIVEANESLFVWVLENLIKNAVDAMEGRGSITLNYRRHANKRILIDITDTGKGIPRNKQSLIFRPGYTTRKRGWGLGLPLAKRIIEEYHRGEIFVHKSELGVGTTFRIYMKEREG